MNLNRSSFNTSSLNPNELESLYKNIDRLLKGPSNFILDKNGRLFIK